MAPDQVRLSYCHTQMICWESTGLDTDIDDNSMLSLTSLSVIDNSHAAWHIYRTSAHTTGSTRKLHVIQVYVIVLLAIAANPGQYTAGIISSADTHLHFCGLEHCCAS